MKRIILILAFFTAVLAQAQEVPNIDEMHLRKWKYITDRCKLLPQESEQVKPLFLEYEQAQWKLTEDFRETMKTVGDRKIDAANFDYEKFNETVVNNDFRKARLFRNYYQKLKVVISAEKIFCFFDAERKYRQELIKDFREQQQPKKPESKN